LFKAVLIFYYITVYGIDVYYMLYTILYTCVVDTFYYSHWISFYICWWSNI